MMPVSHVATPGGKVKYITVNHLKGACEDQVALFRKTFGQSAELTAENWERAIQADLDVLWTIRLLSRPAWEQYEAVECQALFEALLAQEP
jgi:hypothetical protein